MESNFPRQGGRRGKQLSTGSPHTGTIAAPKRKAAPPNWLWGAAAYAYVELVC